ncbi:membrane dipeptidase [Bradyrhizobium sp. 41S5]|uniref:membrane dipeptidase n=1 Tax=Bradyrhizobium sp. 41S5 TaxID=1404443 RepID=UPI00156B247E|nr:membrane dipeptidase [Bradyrhizobium sp. 41S5]UFX42190.1 membrane dipeptidase [Bradyrhizobium sp. 41S5]
MTRLSTSLNTGQAGGIFSCAPRMVISICRVLEVRPDGHRDPDIPIETVVDHLSYLVERMGDDHVALGSDFDGALMPVPLKDASHLPNLIDALRALGFDDAALRKIAFDNWMRVFRQSWR